MRLQQDGVQSWCPFGVFALRSSQILEFHGCAFKSFDVLADERLRAQIKDYSEWPTIPQVYIGREFVGGSDILIEMHQSGELVNKLKTVGIKSKLDDADALEKNKK